MQNITTNLSKSADILTNKQSIIPQSFPLPTAHLQAAYPSIQFSTAPESLLLAHIKEGDIASAMKIIDSHPKLNVGYVDSTKMGFVHHIVGKACMKEEISSYLLLLEKLTTFSAFNINMQDEEGETALSIATNFGHEEMIRCLVLHGADPALKNEHGVSMLDLCLQSDNFDILTIFYSSLDYEDEEGNSLLHLAAQVGATEIVNGLIEKGVDPMAVNQKNQTALMIALRQRHFAIFEKLSSQNREIHYRFFINTIASYSNNFLRIYFYSSENSNTISNKSILLKTIIYNRCEEGLQQITESNPFEVSFHLKKSAMNAFGINGPVPFGVHKLDSGYIPKFIQLQMRHSYQAFYRDYGLAAPEIQTKVLMWMKRAPYQIDKQEAEEAFKNGEVLVYDFKGWPRHDTMIGIFLDSATTGTFFILNGGPGSDKEGTLKIYTFQLADFTMDNFIKLANTQLQSERDAIHFLYNVAPVALKAQINQSAIELFSNNFAFKSQKYQNCSYYCATRATRFLHLIASLQQTPSPSFWNHPRLADAMIKERLLAKLWMSQVMYDILAKYLAKTDGAYYDSRFAKQCLAKLKHYHQKHVAAPLKQLEKDYSELKTGFMKKCHNQYSELEQAIKSRC